MTNTTKTLEEIVEEGIGMLPSLSQKQLPEFLRIFARKIQNSTLDACREALGELPAFHPVDRGYASEVAEDAKDPPIGTRYLARKAALSVIDSLKDPQG